MFRMNWLLIFISAGFILISASGGGHTAANNHRYTSKHWSAKNQSLPSSLEDSSSNVLLNFNTKRREKYAKNNSTSASQPSSKAFYQGRAIDFLREYGMHYRLFDQFFDAHNKLHSRTVPNSFQGRWHASEGISTTYAIRDYDKFRLWNDVKSNPDASLGGLHFHYVDNIDDEKIILFNNRFRYGRGINDRFLSIGFDVDPWTYRDSADEPVYLYFVGYENSLPKANYTCKFHTPSNATSQVEVEYVIYNVLNRPTKNNLVRCPLPLAVLDALNDSVRKIVVSLSQQLWVTERRTVFGPKHQYNETDVLVEHTNVLLAQLSIPKMHTLDKRDFGIAVQTMVDNLEDPMVSEWLVYNILLGVEHFYLFYNDKVSNFDLQSSRLRPFLDANIVTLVYFPYHHTDHFSAIQHVALNAHLHLYGSYADWVGYWDVDEFFLPSPHMRLQLLEGAVNGSACVLCQAVALLADDQVPAIMFDSLDMDCDEAISSFNYFHGGNNLLLESVAGDTGSASPSKDPYQGRVAVSTHCEREGFLLREMIHGHGKMLVRPAAVSYLSSPHRLNHYSTVWTTADHGGLMRHFNRFRNTKYAIDHGEFHAANITKRNDLKSFVLSLLHHLVGVGSIAVTD